MRTKAIAIMLIAAVLTVSVLAWAGVEVKSDKKNIAASRIEGEWAFHKNLTKRLQGGDATSLDRLTFRMDSSVANKIPAMYDKFFKDRQIYAAGILKMKDKEFPFVLIALGGCPHVVYFREKGADPLGDAESFYIMLAAAKDKAKDLLFVGSDMPSGTFAAFERAAQ